MLFSLFGPPFMCGFSLSVASKKRINRWRFVMWNMLCFFPKHLLAFLVAINCLVALSFLVIASNLSVLPPVLPMVDEEYLSVL